MKYCRNLLLKLTCFVFSLMSVQNYHRITQTRKLLDDTSILIQAQLLEMASCSGDSKAPSLVGMPLDLGSSE